MCGSTRAASDKMLIRIDYPSMNAAGSDVMQGFVDPTRVIWTQP